MQKRNSIRWTSGLMASLLVLGACSGGRSGQSTATEEGLQQAPGPQAAADARARQLTFSAGDQAEPSFSPDGRRLIYQNNSDGNWELYWLDLESSESTRITDTPANEEDPSLSPDGRWILCTVHEPTLNENPARDILLISSDGETRRTLVRNAADDWYPRFTPEGDAVLFVSDRGDGRTVADSERRSAIYRVEIVSGTISQLSTGSDDSAPCPLAGGSFLYRDADNRLLRADGSGESSVRLEREWIPGATEAGPAGWALCASEDLRSPSRIWLCGEDFSTPTALDLYDRQADRGPSLSPDGSQLAFYGRVNDQWDLFLVRLGE